MGNFISVWRGSCVKITKIFIFIFLRNPIPKNLKKKKKKKKEVFALEKSADHITFMLVFLPVVLYSY